MIAKQMPLIGITANQIQLVRSYNQSNVTDWNTANQMLLSEPAATESMLGQYNQRFEMFGTEPVQPVLWEKRLNQADAFE